MKSLTGSLKGKMDKKIGEDRMEHGNESLPACFGDLDTVFPMTKSGLRETPDGCMLCATKTACLRKAMEGRGGRNVQEEIIQRSEKAGMMSFFERWSRKKQLSRQKSK